MRCKLGRQKKNKKIRECSNRQEQLMYIHSKYPDRPEDTFEKKGERPNSGGHLNHFGKNSDIGMLHCKILALAQVYWLYLQKQTSQSTSCSNRFSQKEIFASVKSNIEQHNKL